MQPFFTHWEAITCMDDMTSWMWCLDQARFTVLLSFLIIFIYSNDVKKAVWAHSGHKVIVLPIKGRKPKCSQFAIILNRQQKWILTPDTLESINVAHFSTRIHQLKTNIRYWYHDALDFCAVKVLAIPYTPGFYRSLAFCNIMLQSKLLHKPGFYPVKC